MEPYFAMGIFALYVVLVSLLRILPDQDYPRLSAMKKVWGRSRGLALHFIAYIGIPLVLGIVFLGRGVAGFDPARSVPLYAPLHHRHSLPHLYSRPVLPGVRIQPGDVAASGEIPLLLLVGAGNAAPDRPQVKKAKGFVLQHWNLPPHLP